MHPTSESSRVVLVTGGAQRLGRQIALTLAQAGWYVAIHYGRSRPEAVALSEDLRAQGLTSAIFGCDLADEAAVSQLVDQVVAHFGRLDAVVNNASRFEYDDASSFSNANLQLHLGPNLVAPIVLARDLAAHLKGRSPEARGAVVNLLDQKLWNYNPDFLSYTLSKAALEAATTMLAQALAPQVRVVGVAPGLTMPSHLQTQEAFERTHRMAPLGQASRPEDIASAVQFALSNPAITGTTLIIDGGQHLIGFSQDFSMMRS